MTENEVTIDGVRYVAVGAPLDNGCKGCAGELENELCGKILDQGRRCSNDSRKDGREIIWQVAPSSPDELTALRELNRELVEALEEARIYMAGNERLESWEVGSPNDMMLKNAISLIAKARGEK